MKQYNNLLLAAMMLAIAVFGCLSVPSVTKDPFTSISNQGGNNGSPLELVAEIRYGRGPAIWLSSDTLLIETMVGRGGIQILDVGNSKMGVFAHPLKKVQSRVVLKVLLPQSGFCRRSLTSSKSNALAS